MIEIRNLKKSYGEIEALRGISTSIPSGEIVGLLGQNGAGKTTTMKILVGYLLPSDGSAHVDGLDVVENPLEVQQKIGYLPENAPVYEDMLVQEYLAFMAEMRGLDPQSVRQHVGRAVEECAIGHVMTRTIGHLSKGYHQRVGLAAAILHDPQILILDEPTSGLDPNQIAEIRNLIRRMGQTKTIILSTHILPEVEATCDRAVILIDGSIRADGALSELTRSRVQVVRVATDDVAGAAETLGRVEGVRSVDPGPADNGFKTFRLHLDGEAEVGERVAEVARTQGWPLRELKRDDKTLEQVFKELTESTPEVAS
ncbi:MAG: ATP-binding cassette domain-containing protein [bacterium]|nr:ATP-binding cassette domain-containing protein [bacterium]